MLIIPPAITLLAISVINKSMGGEPSVLLAFIGMAVIVLCVLQFFVIQVGTYYWVLAKMWKPLQDGFTPVTVGKAIGFSFIPIYRVYWHLIAMGSYPKEYNNYIKRYNLPIAPIKDGVFKAFSISSLLADILIIPIIAQPFFLVFVIIEMCKANNALINAKFGKYNGNLGT